MQISKECKKGFQLSLPTFFAYFPLGLVYAVLWIKAGFPAFWAPITSLFVYAGAVQFAALSMMQEHAGLVAILLASTFIASRSLFYGLSLIERFKPKPKWLKAFLIFGIVDATYAIFMVNPESEEYDDNKLCFFISLFPYVYWVAGTVLGLLLYKSIPDLKGLDFMLTSFYMILVTDYYIVSRNVLSLIMPLVFVAIWYLLLPHEYLLLSIVSSVFFIYFFEVRNKEQS